MLCVYKEPAVWTGCLLAHGMPHNDCVGRVHILTAAVAETRVDLPSSPIILRCFDIWPFTAVGHTHTSRSSIACYCVIIIIIIIIIIMAS